MEKEVKSRLTKDIRGLKNPMVQGNGYVLPNFEVMLLFLKV